MKLSAELSLYPLAEEYRPVIRRFIEALQQWDGLTIRVNTMSTQIFGDYDQVMAALTTELKEVYTEVPAQSLVCKFINRDLTPDDSPD